MFSSRAINTFKICPLSSIKVCSENIITMERRKDDKFGKNYRPGVALEAFRARFSMLDSFVRSDTFSDKTVNVLKVKLRGKVVTLHG